MEADDELVYKDDCGSRMVANATGQCNPRPGELTAGTVERGGIPTSHPDGTITVHGQVLRECVIATAAAEDCGSTCCVNPQLAALRETVSVSSRYNRDRASESPEGV